MKLDKTYTYIPVCPVTKSELTYKDINRTDGVCPKCGHISSYTTHNTKVVGRYRRPNVWEFVLGERAEFVTKESEDKIINALTDQ